MNRLRQRCLDICSSPIATEFLHDRYQFVGMERLFENVRRRGETEFRGHFVRGSPAGNNDFRRGPDSQYLTENVGAAHAGKIQIE